MNEGDQRLENEQGVALPHRDSIPDMRQTLTHNTVIIKQFLQNVPTPEIARRTSYSKEAYGRYIKTFKKVRKLFANVVPPENIASDQENESLTCERIYCHNR
jgi:hypothetical protein